MMKLRFFQARAAVLAGLAPLAVGAVLLSPPLPAAAQTVGPTDKDQCKSGGWLDFLPIFKNQGDCINSAGAPAGGGPAVDPAATPELGSLVLFGGGAAGFAGYAWTRLRAGRASARADAPDETPAA